jgi:hypothetical protein
VRTVQQTVQSLAALGILIAGAAALDVRPAAAFCGVFHGYPCLPTTVCSVFSRHPCVRYPDYWIGQDLRLTIESADSHAPSMKMDSRDDPDAADHKLDTLHAMFDALRACWVPPASDEARPGMQMSVRFAFKRSGRIIATPRVTYVSPGAPPETREVYLHAITAALERCTPLPLSEGLGRAVAGRPIAIRFVDDRLQP